MPPVSVEVREYKPVDLSGGTLVVSVPFIGLGNIFFTDYMLNQLRMDQVAALDSEGFPPIANLWEGKPRFPVRIHADPRSRIAILRSEFTPLPQLARPIALAILKWAHEKNIARIITLDCLLTPPSERSEDPMPVWVVGGRDRERVAAPAGTLRDLRRGTLGGIPAVLLLEGRFHKSDVVSLFASTGDAMDEARAVLAFARALPAFVPGLRLDSVELERELGKLEQVVRSVRQEAENALERLRATPAQPEPAMYG